MKKQAQPPFASGGIVRFLLKISLLATETRNHAAAREIIDILIAVRPDLPQPRLSLSHSVGFTAGPKASRQALVELLQDFPDFQMGWSMLALNDRDNGVAGWQGLAQRVIDDGRDESAMRLAEFVLGLDCKSEAARAATAAGPRYHGAKRIIAV